MTLYYAIKDKICQNVATDEAADKMLAQGYTIIAQDMEERMILATPEKGWMTERPAIQRTFSGRSR